MTGVAVERMALHTITTKPLSLAKCVNACAVRGIAGICPWVEHVEPIGADAAARVISDAGLDVPAYVRGGFFVSPDASARAAAIERGRALLDDAATMKAKCLVIVPGSSPEVPLAKGRDIVRDALVQLCEHATGVGVRLAIEPLHPMYAATRSCVNSLTQARQMCEAIEHASLGVAVDVYHVWWDDRLADEISRLGAQKRLLAFHVNDWLTHTADLLTDRGLMGEGCIPIREIRTMMEAAGFDGPVEVEILSERHWNRDQGRLVDDVVRACRECV